MGETKIRIQRKGGYTVLPNEVLRDPALNLQTKGLFCMMLSFPESWDFSVAGLAAVAGCGRDKIRRALEDLEEVGYLIREQGHAENGKFSGNVYVLQDWKEPPLPGFPATGKPATGKPSPENPTEINKDLINNPLKSPVGGRRRREWKEAPDWKPERFENFWRFYPAKGRKDKQKAIRAWDKLKPDDELLAEIAAALKKLMATEEWQREIGIPYVSTFLNGQRWHDADALSTPAKERGEAFGWAI
jgi:hypothetical protein